MSKQLYSAEYQDAFLAHVLSDTEFAALTLPSLDPLVFGNELAQRLLRVIKAFHDQHQNAPGGLVLEVISDWAKKGTIPTKLGGQLCAYAASLLEKPLQNRKYLLERYDEFLRYRKLTGLLTKVVYFTKKENLDKAEELILEHVRGREDNRALKERDGGFYDVDPSKRTLRRANNQHEKFYTLIRPLDAFDVGLKRGHFGLLVSQFSGAGKSVALTHFAVAALFQGRKVLYLVIGEMDREEVEDRLDSMISGLKMGEQDEGNRLVKRLQNLFRFGGNLRIETFAADAVTVEDLRRISTEIENTESFKPDLVIIDYMDNIRPEHATGDNLFLAGDEVAKSLKRWAKEEKVGVWTAAQGKTEAQDATVVGQKHVGGSRGKVQQADLLISLNRTPEEIEQGIIRLAVAKWRHGQGMLTVTIKCDFSRMQFYVGEHEEEDGPITTERT